MDRYKDRKRSIDKDRKIDMKDKLLENYSYVDRFMVANTGIIL